jgi:hypothetical protein
VTSEVYTVRQKTCKGPCERSLPGTAAYFQRCKKYKDGLESWCKPCSREKRKARQARVGKLVEHAPRYYVDQMGQLRCVQDHSRIYDSGQDGEWYCIATGHYVNPPAKPLRVMTRRHATLDGDPR